MKSNSVSWRSPVAAASSSLASSSTTHSSSNINNSKNNNHKNNNDAATSGRQLQIQQQQQQHQRSATMNGYHHHYDYYHTPQAPSSVYHQQRHPQQTTPHRHYSSQQLQHYSSQQYEQQQQVVVAVVPTTPPPPPILVLDATNPTPVALMEQASRQNCSLSSVVAVALLTMGGGKGRGKSQKQEQQSQQSLSCSSSLSSSARRRARHEMTNHHPVTVGNSSSHMEAQNMQRQNQIQQQPQQQRYHQQHHQQQHQQLYQQHVLHATPTTTNAVSTPTLTTVNTIITAAQFARTAPRAGFLTKQGINIPLFKRRFFVLQPATHLYYFVSPTDTTPRGCLDLTDSWIVDLEKQRQDKQQQAQQQQRQHQHQHEQQDEVDGYLPDPSIMHGNQHQHEHDQSSHETGHEEERTYRFAICWEQNQQESNNNNCHHNDDHDDGHDDVDCPTGGGVMVKRIVLQARNAKLAHQWMQAIQCERLDYYKQRYHEATAHATSLQQTIVDLQHELHQLRLVEADRDGALLDAQSCRRDLDALNQAVRKLALQLARPLPPTAAASAAAAPARNFTSHQQQVSSDEVQGVGETGNNNNNNDNNNTVNDDPEKAATIGEDEKKEEPDITAILQQQQQQDSENDKNDAAVILNLQQPGRGRDLLNSSLLDDETVPPSSDTEHQAELAWLERHDNDDHDNDEALEYAAVLEHDVQQQHDDFLNVPGVHFSSLYNACQQLRDNWQLASQEAATAIHDVTQHEANRHKLEARMKRAERHLCQIWEENCALRKSIKQKKREKRVLVREVRNLQDQQQRQQHQTTTAAAAQEQTVAVPVTAAAAASERNNTQQQQPGETSSRRSVRKDHVVHDARRVQSHQHQQQQQQCASGSAAEEDESSDEDEERLINELEEHVQTSIRLHEQILGANGSSTTRKRKEDACSAAASLSTAITTGTAATSCETSQASRPASHNGEDESQAMSKLSGSMGSKALFDDSDEENDDESHASRPHEEETQEDNDRVDVSSTCAEASVMEETTGRPTVNDTVILVRNTDSPDSTPERPNPLLRLDDDSISVDHLSNVCAASSQSESSRSTMVTSTGQATSQLACPFADVVDRNGTRSDLSGVSGDLQVYHLTFYSRKIGLQFQKVPPPPIKSKGLLTEALTADLTGVTTGSGNTAAELRRIASMSTWAEKSDLGYGGSHGRNDNDAPVLEVATPIDAVLVCGFHGFDDSGSNIRPKLGARLVAFDGVSVEVGRWTFESIRKSIQARSRPLTLSFRNDFLTTEQRTILTKAVKDVDAAVPPPRPTIQYRVVQNSSRPPSATPSMQTNTSHESDVFINDIPASPVLEEDLNDHYRNNDAWSVSVSGSSCDLRSNGGGSRPQSFSAARSVSSAYSSSNRQQQHSSSFRSFSDAGSSTSVLSAVGPLMAQLLRKKEQPPFTPEYLRREGSSLEDTPQHQDFKSSLL